MANKTKNFGLTMPTPEEFYDVKIQNGNMEKIDAELQKQAEHTNDKDNPHNVTAEQVGAVPVLNGVAMSNRFSAAEQEGSTEGGIFYGVIHSGANISGIGTIRGSSTVCISSFCQHSDKAQESAMGTRGFCSNISYTDPILPSALVVGGSVDGYEDIPRDDLDLWFMKAKEYRVYKKDEFIPMEACRVLHTGNIKPLIRVVESASYSEVMTELTGYPSYYYKDAVGIVHLHIIAQISADSGLHAAGVFELPLGYRPVNTLSIPASVTTDGLTKVNDQLKALIIVANSGVSVYNSSLHPKGTVYSASVSFYAGG